jgi:hypothetical protein
MSVKTTVLHWVSVRVIPTVVCHSGHRTGLLDLVLRLVGRLQSAIAQRAALLLSNTESSLRRCGILISSLLSASGCQPRTSTAVGSVY